MNKGKGNVRSDQVELFAEMLLHLKRLADATEVIAKRSSSGSNREDEAILLIGRLGPNVRLIAESMGVTRQSLYNWPRFKAALQSVRLAQAGASVERTGYKDSSGEFDAWEE